jgi:TrmH family RNA methyltransferase
MITSRQNVRVKAAAKLRQRRQRSRQGRFLIDGAREIRCALDLGPEAGIEIHEVFVCDAFCTLPTACAVVDRLERAGVDVARVTPAVFEKLCFGRREEGVVAVASAQPGSLEDLPLPPQPLIAVLEGIEKPGNVGAILRSADGAGLDGVILADRRTDRYNPSTIRASLGTVFRPNICVATTTETLQWLHQQQLPLVAARPDADRLYTQVDYRAGAAIVLGSEAEGLSPEWQGAQVVPVNLPMQGIADSLNVSATAAVLFYEAVRQREAGSKKRKAESGERNS